MTNKELQKLLVDCSEDDDIFVETNTGYYTISNICEDCNTIMIKIDQK